MSSLRMIILMFAIVSIAIAVFAVFNNSMIYNNTEKFYDNNLPKMMLFYATWCPHCEDYLNSGIFDKVGQKYNGEVNFEKIDYDQNKELAEEYNVQSFPTLVLVDNSKNFYKFEGNRMNHEELANFINSKAVSK